MNNKRIISRTGWLALICATSVALAGAADARPTTYRLTGAAYTEGCFELCACPIWFAPMSGKFRLTPVNVTGTVDSYAVSDVHWLVNGVNMTITGSGTYTRHSEFAVLNRLELDLEIDSEPAAHFDSGWVPAGAPWPTINISIALNGEPSCYDIRLGVVAKPLRADLNGDGVVNVDDLVAVITNWGDCPRDADPCAGDVAPDPAGDHAVNIDDLIKVIIDWG